jgi:methylated-DNA-[protein]-cysteine S-methyltransferase
MSASTAIGRAPTTIFWEEVDSPLGTFLVAGQGRTLVAARLPGGWSRTEVPTAWVHRPGALGEASSQLGEYFAGTRRDFQLTFVPRGTPFQLSVWRALEEIPYATTVTYRHVATKVGNERATRAVGMANNRNPIALFVPCHRVIGADGSLTGYGGGLEMKSWLLDHERTMAASDPR